MFRSKHLFLHTYMQAALVVGHRKTIALQQIRSTYTHTQLDLGLNLTVVKKLVNLVAL